MLLANAVTRWLRMRIFAHGSVLRGPERARPGGGAKDFARRRCRRTEL